VRTPIGWEQGPELFDVTLKGIGRDGKPHQGITEYSLVKLDDLEGRYNVSDYTENGEVGVHQLPAGTYDLTRFQYRTNADGDVSQLVSSDIPELTVKGDMTVTEVFTLPGAPASWGTLENTTISQDGRMATSTNVLTPSDGWIGNGWCAAKGDPVGDHLIEVWLGDELLGSFPFVVE
jgi:hypothetical protein